MRVMYGPEVPRPVEVFLSRWSANRFTRGSFHSFARGCSSSVVKDISRNVGRLYFAGTVDFLNSMLSEDESIQNEKIGRAHV